MDHYWNPFHGLDLLRRGLDDVFADLWPAGRSRRSAFLPGHAARAYPLLNIAAFGDRYLVEAFAPGLDRDSLEVSVDRNVLSISGEKRDVTDVATEKFHRRERAAGRFLRTVHLDSEIDDERVEAHYENGILHIDLDVRVEDNLLTIHGYMPPHDPVGYLSREFALHDYHRQFTLGDRVARDRIEASLEHGVLTLKLPYAEQAKPRA